MCSNCCCCCWAVVASVASSPVADDESEVEEDGSVVVGFVVATVATGVEDEVTIDECKGKGTDEDDSSD